MRKIQASEAKARFAELLDDVERGETIAITRRGREIARVVPASEGSKANVIRTMEKIEALRKRMPRLTTEEILSARHEGHKY